MVGSVPGRDRDPVPRGRSGRVSAPERAVGSALRLRPLLERDEASARRGHAELGASDGFPFLLRWESEAPWAGYLQLLARHRAGVEVPPDWVPAAFLVAHVGGDLVGRVSIRHRLNDQLAAFGGHIGYAVRPAHRGRGHAAGILRRALVVARAEGVERVLVTCRDDNAASAAVITGCGGVLEDVRRDRDDRRMHRYWIR